MPKIGAEVNQILSDCCDLKPLPTSVGKAAAMDLLSPLSANQTHTRAHTRTKKENTLITDTTHTATLQSSNITPFLELLFWLSSEPRPGGSKVQPKGLLQRDTKQPTS